MKKLLLVLTVVVMASFLLVGCFGTTPIAVTGVTLDQATMTLTAGGATGTLVATVAPADASDTSVTWSSSALAVATVAAGVVTPLTEGTSTITVTTVDGSLTDTCEVTVEAAVVNTAPVITAIANQTTTLGELFSYPVVATDADGDTLTYSLTECPLLMEISAAGVITWTPEFDTQLGPQAVVVEVSDGIDVATGGFVLTVAPAPEPDPLVIDIDVPDAYVHPTKGPIVAADCYDVVVTFSDNSITEGEDVWARWNDVGGNNGPWVLLDANADYTEFTEEICFDTAAITECVPICIEVKVGTICCDPIIYSETITVDSIAPCASFTVTFEDCGICEVPPGANMAWTTACLGDCGVGSDCCGDNCSGVGDWEFVLDDDYCLGACDTETGNDCDITGAFECGCLTYDDIETEGVNEGIHEVLVSIKDNVGNEFKDTWTITFDTDNVLSVDGLTVSGSTPVYDVVKDEWTVEVDYSCTWTDCTTCFPSGE